MKSKRFVTRKATRLAQRTQTLTRGYFGGYIAKAQPAGHMERATILKKNRTFAIKGRNAVGLQKTSTSQRNLVSYVGEGLRCKGSRGSGELATEYAEERCSQCGMHTYLSNVYAGWTHVVERNAETLP